MKATRKALPSPTKGEGEKRGILYTQSGRFPFSSPPLMGEAGWG
jgi:hypothetical protein